MQNSRKMLLQIVLVACFIIIGSEGDNLRGNLWCYMCDEDTDCINHVGRLVRCSSLKYSLLGLPLKEGNFFDTMKGWATGLASFILKDHMHCVHFGLTSHLQIRSCFASKLPFDIPRILSMHPLFHGVAHVCTTNGCNNHTFVVDIPEYVPPATTSIAENSTEETDCADVDEEEHAHNFAISFHFNFFHLFGCLCGHIVIRMVHVFNCL